MGRYGMENFERFNASGVTPEDIEILKIETVEEAFISAEKDIKNLMRQLVEGIKEGRWTTIIGDDVSGRFVAKIVGDIANHYAKNHKQSPPKRIFIAGGGLDIDDPEILTWSPDESQQKLTERQQTLEEYIQNIRDKLGDRALIVTEQLRRGSTIKKFAKALKANGIDFDVASMWTSETAEENLKNLQDNNEELFQDVNLFSGQENAGASDPFGSTVSNYHYNLGAVLNEATGVKKDNIKPITKLNPKADKKLIQLANQKCADMADKLYNEFFTD